MHMLILPFFIVVLVLSSIQNYIPGFKTQHSFETLQEKKERQHLKESEITEQALIKLLRITVFIVQKHWAHTTNYEDFVRFVGTDLQEEVLKSYLELTDSHKNATYLSSNTVSQFLKHISNWMLDQTLCIVRKCDYLTIMLDESTDESNRSELSLIARIVNNGSIENHFLDLKHLTRCDASSIFTTVETYLREKEIEINRVKFAGMDGCSTMAGEHNGVKSHLEKATSHFHYIHCRNHRLALCFAHLIPRYNDFQKFDSLLLNLFLLLKNSSVKQSIFNEVQNAYGLQSLKLIKAAVTRWLSHGKAAERVLDRFESLVAALDEIYLRKHEPAVRGVRDDLVEPKNIAMLCFLADVLKSTNALQTTLQGSRLNFLDIPPAVDKLIAALKKKAENPEEPSGGYFSRLNEFLEIASKSAGSRFNTRSSSGFDAKVFKANTIEPFIRDLIEEIENAFDIPEHMKGFTILDPLAIPLNAESLSSFDSEGIASLGEFYGQAVKVKNDIMPPLVDAEALKIQYEVYKVFILKGKLEFENEQRTKLSKAEVKLVNNEKTKSTMSSLLSDRKLLIIEKNIKKLRKEIDDLNKNLVYTFEIASKEWFESPLSAQHKDISTVLELTGLIPPSTAEVERSFSLMKLICTKLRKSMTTDTLSSCMRICKFRKLKDADYEDILKQWLKADDTKSKKRKVASLM